MPQNSKPLAGKVALVTGGSRSIGAAIAKRLADDGATVAITYNQSGERAEGVVKDIEASGGRAVAIKADAGDSEAVRSAVERVAKEFGKIDILVNSAGIAFMKPADLYEPAEYDRMIAVNVNGVFVASQAAARHMTSGGRIIHIGSVMTRYTAFENFSVYALTKGAVQGFSRGLARELASRDITVNTVMPGPTGTDMNPADGPFSEILKSRIALGRYAETSEIAAVVAFVAGPDASFVTGAEILADGGLSA